jgi:hypothetical protein
MIALEIELRLRGRPFDRADVTTFAEGVWLLAEDDPEPGRWADAFLVAHGANMEYKAATPNRVHVVLQLNGCSFNLKF